MKTLLFYSFPLFLIACVKAPENKAISSAIETSPEYKKGESFYESQQPDSAFYYFNSTVTQSKDSLQIAMAYNKMAVVQNDLGDYFGSQESSLKSLQYLDRKNKRDEYCLMSSYNELGITNLYLKNYDTAISYFDQTLQFITDNEFRVVTLNNKALAYQKKKAYAQAISIYETIIDSSKKNPGTFARVLSNFARSKWLLNPAYDAENELRKAMHIRREAKDSWGLSASYGHLADYYTQSQPDSSLYYATALYQIAQYLKSPDDELDAIAKLIPLSSASKAKQYFERHQQLTDSLQTARNNAKNQFALIRYNTEKYKADKLILQKENAEKKLRIIWQQVILIVFIVLVLIGFSWYRKRKKRLIKEQQLRTSQKVHDVVANGLYRMIKTIEYEPNIEKEQLLDDMEALYNQSRDLSYEPPEIALRRGNGLLPELVKSFSTPEIRISIVGYSEKLWSRLTPDKQKHIHHILQELMINMRKHSEAKNVVIKFDQLEKEIKLQYTDDGKGLPQDLNYGNGLISTENRISNMKGRIIFDRSTPNGLKIQMFIPIA